MTTPETSIGSASNSLREKLTSGGKTKAPSVADKLRNQMQATSETYAKQVATPETEKVLEGEKIVLLDPQDIDPNPFQNRRDFDEEAIESLSHSIAANGQNQTIGVRRFRNRYQIIFGERRWRAIRKLPGVKIAVVIRDLSDLEMIFICSSENSNRKKPYDYERWITIHQLHEMKQSMEVICHRLNLRRDQYYKLNKYGELHPDIKAFLEVKPKALQINEASDLEKIFKDLKEDVDVEEVVKFALKLMDDYISGELKTRPEIIKKIKAKYVDIKPRQREKMLTESELNMGDVVVGKLVNTPEEFRVIISKEECDQEKIEQLKKLVEDFFKS